MNLTDFQQKINNFIIVISSWFRVVGKLYFSSTPENVEVQMIDDDGNLVDTTLPNVAQFRKQVWDDVSNALGQFNKKIYVDSNIGNDLNDGSLSSPFLTIKKCIESIPIGGRATIYLKTDMEIKDNHSFLNQNIDFRSGVSGENMKLIFKVFSYKNDFDCVYNISLYSSVLRVHSVDLEIEAPRIVMVPSGYNGKYAILSKDAYSSIYLNRSETIVNEDADGNGFYLFGDQGYDNATSIINITTYNAVFKKNNGAILRLNKCNASLSLSRTSFTNIAGYSRDLSTDFISGIQRDADSGNPVNVISNHNFSS